MIFFHVIAPYIIFPFIGFLISLFLTKLLIKILPLIGFIDKPDSTRRIHTKPTPRGGGIAIIIAFYISVILFLLSPYSSEQYHFISYNKLFILTIPAAILIITGLIDDRYGMRARYKLIAQYSVGIICWSFGIRFSFFLGWELPIVISFILTVLWIVGFINAINIIDGLDGLAAGLGVVSSVCMGSMFILNNSLIEGVLVLSIGAGCLGFLRYNFHPAKIFMGDSGSMFIGFVFGIVGIASSYKAVTLTAVLIPILAMGVPIFDGLLAIWRRLSRKILRKITPSNDKYNSEVFTADLHHIHHRVLSKLKDQKRTVLYFYNIAIALSIVAVSLIVLKDQQKSFIFIILLIIVVTFFRRLASIELWNSMQVFKGLQRPMNNALYTLVHPTIDLIIVSSAYLITTSLFTGISFDNALLIILYHGIIFTVFPIILILNLSKVYKIYWLKVSSNDFLYLVKTLFISYFISYILFYFFSGFQIDRYILTQLLFFYLLTSCFLIGERLFLRHINNTFVHDVYKSMSSEDTLTNIVLYGGGINCKFYLNLKSLDVEKDPINVVGIIDDDSRLRNQYLYNQKVLGNLNELERIYGKYNFKRIVITTRHITQENKDTLKKFCQGKDIILSEAFLSENKITD